MQVLFNIILSVNEFIILTGWKIKIVRYSVNAKKKHLIKFSIHLWFQKKPQTLRKLEIEGNLLNLTKRTYKNSLYRSLYLLMKTFSLRSGWDNHAHCQCPINIVLKVLASKARKRHETRKDRKVKSKGHCSQVIWLGQRKSKKIFR